MKNINYWTRIWGETEINFPGLIKEVQDDAYLSALKDAEIGFMFMSDMSTKTQGYANLQRRIKELENDKSS